MGSEMCIRDRHKPNWPERRRRDTEKEKKKKMRKKLSKFLVSKKDAWISFQSGSTRIALCMAGLAIKFRFFYVHCSIGGRTDGQQYKKQLSNIRLCLYSSLPVMVHFFMLQISKLKIVGWLFDQSIDLSMQMAFSSSSLGVLN